MTGRPHHLRLVEGGEGDTMRGVLRGGGGEGIEGGGEQRKEEGTEAAGAKTIKER